MQKAETYLIYTMDVTIISSVDDNILEKYISHQLKKQRRLPVNICVLHKKSILKTHGCKVKVDLLTPATGTIEEGSPS